MQPYRILSLDGGGPWSLIQAKALGNLFPGRTGREILQAFNLVAGNSGGSIVTAALACDFTPDQIFDLFNSEANRRRFFEETWYAFFTRAIKLGPRYRTSKKLDGLRAILNRNGALEQPLVDLPAWCGLANTHFLITAFDYDRERAVYFRSNAASLAGSPPPSSSRVTLGNAVHTSSNAPINYFNRPAVIGDHKRYWDGGLSGLNNPVFAAVIEALANRQSRDCIQVLSIGTGSTMLPVEDGDVRPPLARARKPSWIVADIKKAVATILADPPDAATFHAYVALDQPLPQAGDEISLVRMNPAMQPIWDGAAWRLPDGLSEEQFETLVEMDLDALGQDQIELITRLCELWLDDSVPNQPIRAGENLSCDVGHDRFSRAKAAWYRLSPPMP